MKTLLLVSALYSISLFAAPSLTSEEQNQIRHTFPDFLQRNSEIKSTPLSDYVAWSNNPQITIPSMIRKDFRIIDFAPIPPGGNPGKFFGKNDLAKERADQFARMNKEPLITVKYGDGRKKLLIISAPECPTCKKLESELSQNENVLNATIYYVPVRLNGSADPVLSNFWCASGDKGNVWLNWWKTGALPTQVTPNCQYSYKDSYALWKFFGQKEDGRLTGTPTVVQEDGTTYAGYPPDKGDFLRMFGGTAGSATETKVAAKSSVASEKKAQIIDSKGTTEGAVVSRTTSAQLPPSIEGFYSAIDNQAKKNLADATSCSHDFDIFPIDPARSYEYGMKYIECKISWEKLYDELFGEDETKFLQCRCNRYHLCGGSRGYSLGLMSKQMSRNPDVRRPGLDGQILDVVIRNCISTKTIELFTAYDTIFQSQLREIKIRKDSEFEIANRHVEEKRAENERKKAEEEQRKETDRINQVLESNDAQAQYDLGRFYYDKMNYSVAFKLFSKGAEKNHVDSLGMLGNMYAYGSGVKKDKNKALSYYKKSAEKETGSYYKWRNIYEHESGSRFTTKNSNSDSGADRYIEKMEKSNAMNNMCNTNRQICLSSCTRQQCGNYNYGSSASFYDCKMVQDPVCEARCPVCY